MSLLQQLKEVSLKHKLMLRDNRTGTIYWLGQISPDLRVFLNKIQPFPQKYLNPLCCVIPVSKTSLRNFNWGAAIHFLNTIFTKTWEIYYDWKCWRKQFFSMNFLLLKGSHHSSQYVVLMTVPLGVQSNEYSSLTIFIKWHTLKTIIF